MNEDDTFRVLSRPSYKELSSLYRGWIESMKIIHQDNTTVRRFLTEHGWTIEEYIIERDAKTNRR